MRPCTGYDTSPSAAIRVVDAFLRQPTHRNHVSARSVDGHFLIKFLVRWMLIHISPTMRSLNLSLI